MMDSQAYRFVALTANTRTADGRFEERAVVLDIRAHDETATKYLAGVWHKMSQAVSKYHELAGDDAGCPGWVSWKPHDWCKEQRGVEDRLKFVAWNGSAMAGFLFLRPGFVSPHDPARRVMYVENVATVPGNHRTKIWCRQLRFVGLALLAFAVLQSKEDGFAGLLGLHAADDEALSYYRGMPDLLGGPVFLPEVAGVPGPPPRGGAAATRPYLE